VVAGGWDLAEARYGQSAGHLMSTSRFVPQQTGQISRPIAGQDRLAGRA
jgi:hypothetical protein